MFRKLVSVALGLSLIFVPELKAKQRDEDHQVLWNSLTNAGITILLNHTNLCDNGVSGMYSPTHRVLIVCQDGRLPLTSKEVSWTSNDYDTLRHEAHHVLQDCLDGIHNDTIVPLFTDEKFDRFVNNALSHNQIKRIISTYKEIGADDDEIKTELEAFAVAESISATTIAQSIDKTCKI